MENKDKRILFIFSLIFAAVSLATAVVLVFGITQIELRLQAINWFVLAIVCLLFPYVLPLIKSISLPGGTSVQMGAHDQIASALQQIEHYLFEDQEINFSDLKKELANKNPRAIETIYHYLDGWRTQQVFQIIRAPNDEARMNTRKQISKLEPIFKLLIDTRESNDPYLHNYYSRLAYVYKDMAEPNWKEAYNKINLAVENAPKGTDMSFTIYKFNRLICAIKYFKKPTKEKQKQMDEDFHDCRNEYETLKMLTGTDEHIAPGLREWLKTPDREADIKRSKDRFEAKNEA